MKRQNYTASSIAEVGILCSLALILQVVGSYTIAPLFRFAFAEGWAPFLASIPLVFILVRRGVILAVIAAIVVESLNYLITNENFIIVGSINAFLIDYIIAKVLSILIAGIVGIAISKLKEDNMILYIIIITTVYLTIGMLAGTWSGAVFYGEYAEWSGAWIYSLVYNFTSYIIPYILIIIIVFVLNRNNKEIFTVKEEGY